MRVRKRDYSGICENQICGCPYFTKPENDLRFWKGMFEGRLEIVGTNYPNYGILLLREDARKALEARIIGKLDYDAETDIDRYMVDCLAIKRFVERCPVFEELKRWLGELRDRMAVGADQKLPDGDGTSYIDDGDGSVGPIAAKPDGGVDFRAKGSELDAICEKCIYRSDNAAECGDGANQAICKRKHEGIIAKIKSMFKRKEEKDGNE